MDLTSLGGYDELHHDRRVERKRRHSERRTGGPPSIPEKLHESVGRAVRHLMLACESGRGGDVDANAKNLPNPFQPTRRRDDRAHALKGALSGRLLRSGEVDVPVHEPRMNRGPLPQGDLPGDPGEASVLNDRDVGPDGTRRGWKGDRGPGVPCGRRHGAGYRGPVKTLCA